MPSVRRALPPLTLALALAAPGAAFADPPRTDSDPCRGHRQGEVCEADDFEGTCRRRRCTRETERGMRTFFCLVCESRRRHGHHRHRDAATDAEDATVADVTAPDDAPDVPAVDAPDVATPDAHARPDAPVTRRAPPPPARSLFDCAAAPARDEGAACGALLVAVCAALQRRARGRRRGRAGAG
ncbi:MAG: hypothetical protein U0324_34050 [Polyangiales bacterium]